MLADVLAWLLDIVDYKMLSASAEDVAGKCALLRKPSELAQVV